MGGRDSGTRTGKAVLINGRFVFSAAAIVYAKEREELDIPATRLEGRFSLISQAIGSSQKPPGRTTTPQPQLSENPPINCQEKPVKRNAKPGPLARNGESSPRNPAAPPPRPQGRGRALLPGGWRKWANLNLAGRWMGLLWVVATQRETQK